MQKFRNHKLLSFLLIMAMLLSVFAIAGCQQQEEPAPQQQAGDKAPTPEDPQLTLATTTSTQDSGLLDVILRL